MDAIDFWPIWGAATLQVVVTVVSSAITASRRRSEDLVDARLTGLHEKLRTVEAQYRDIDRRHQDLELACARREEVTEFRAELRNDIERLQQAVDARIVELRRETREELAEQGKKLDELTRQNGQILALLEPR